MRKSLTDLACRTAKSGGKPQQDFFDASHPGLALRVTKAGRRTWTFVYTVPGTGRRARMGLGSYPGVSLDEARQRVVKARRLIEEGKDPGSVPVEAPSKLMSELTEERLAMEVLGVPDDKGGWTTPPLRTASEIAKRYRKQIIPVVGAVAVKDFKIDPHYNSLINPYRLKGKLRRAGVFHTDLVTLMNFAVDQGVREYNPLASKKSPDPRNIRERNLTPAEIVTFWHELPKALVRSKVCQRILKLLLATGQRVSEVSGARRAEFDWVKLTWTIPRERVKNGKKYGAHVVPLSPLAAWLFREAFNATNSDFLFPNDAGNGGFAARALSHAAKNSLAAGDFNIEPWTPHDLRRTVGTQMLNKENKLGIPKFHKYLVLNHRSATKGNVSDEVYDMNEYLEEKRDALDKWGRFLADLVGETVELREVA